MRCYNANESRIRGKQDIDSPRDITFANGKILITDFNKQKILSIDPNLKKVKVFGKTGSSPELLRPQGIRTDSEGNIIVADCNNHRIQVNDLKLILFNGFVPLIFFYFDDLSLIFFVNMSSLK